MNETPVVNTHHARNSVQLANRRNVRTVENETFTLFLNDDFLAASVPAATLLEVYKTPARETAQVS